MSRPSVAAPVLVRAAATVGVAAVTLVAALGCQPASSGGQPILTDPAEVVMAGIHSAAALHTVHAHLDLSFQSAGQPAGQQFGGRAAADVDVDLQTRNLLARTVTSGQGGPDQSTEVLFVDGQQFLRSAPSTRWTTFAMIPGQAPFPTNEQLVATISSVVGSSGVALQLADAEACGAGTCYHVIADLDPAASWQLISSLTASGGGNGPPLDGLALPPITLHILVDQASRALVSVNTTFSLQGTSLVVAVSLTNQDAPFDILPPPPGQVDQFDFGGNGVIPPDGGAPAPTPQVAEPVPAEPVSPPPETP